MFSALGETRLLCNASLPGSLFQLWRFGSYEEPERYSDKQLRKTDQMPPELLRQGLDMGGVAELAEVAGLVAIRHAHLLIPVRMPVP